MLKPRIRAVERRLAQHKRPEPTALRVVTIRNGEPEPKAGPGESLLIIRIVDPQAEDAAAGIVPFGKTTGKGGPNA